MPDCTPWAAILAGGEGRRLRPLTRSIAGDARPKQFCRFFGDQTLLEDTRERLSHNVASGRTLYVVSAAHERFYREVLPDVPSSHLIEQSVNRGTTAAVASVIYALRGAIGCEPVGFFPADHYYRDAVTLRQTITAAYAIAARRPDTVILLGSEATRAETEYGWIEPAPPGVAPGPHGLRGVQRFWEKPADPVARELFHRGCLWNTLLVVGQVSAFEALLARAVPDIWQEFARLPAADSPEGRGRALHHAYAMIRASDFSQEVLVRCPEHLSVLALPDVGWTDLGQPHRVLDVLAERHEVLGSGHVAAS